MILRWIRIEALDWALGAGSQEICPWIVRSWSLGNPSRKIIIKGVGKKGPYIYVNSIKNYNRNGIHELI